MRLMPTSMTVAPGFTYSAVDQLGPANGGDQDVGLPGDCRQVGSAAVGLTTVASTPLAPSSSARGRPTRNERPTTTAVLPLRLDVVVREDAHHPAWCRRTRAPALEHERAEVVRMQPIGVLGGVDGLDGTIAVEAVGQRQLHDHAVDSPGRR